MVDATILYEAASLLKKVNAKVVKKRDKLAELEEYAENLAKEVQAIRQAILDEAELELDNTIQEALDKEDEEA